MRIALVCGAMRPREDGVADYTAQLARRLVERGVEVTVLTGGEVDPEPVAGLDARRVTAAWSLRGVARAASAIRALAPDLVHVQFAPSAYGFRRAIGLLPLLLGSGRGSAPAPLVVTLHEYGSWPWQPRWLPVPAARALGRAGERAGRWDQETLWLVSRADAVLCVRDESAGALRARRSDAAVRVIPIASNIAVHPTARDEARAALRHRLGVPEDAPVAAFFGFLHPVKGLPYLLDAVTRLRDQHPWLRLVIAGGFTSLALPQVEADAYRGEIEATIARLGLQPVVHLTGWQPEPEVSRLLQGADLAVLPFTQGVTAKSGSLFAVLAHGLPTVATSPPGEPSDPEPGMLRVPVRDPQALADAIGRLLDDPDLAARLAAEARAAVPADPWGAIANAHCEVYTQLLSARRPVPAA